MIKKAVIPAASLGTRFLPAKKSLSFIQGSHAKLTFSVLQKTFFPFHSALLSNYINKIIIFTNNLIRTIFIHTSCNNRDKYKMDINIHKLKRNNLKGRTKL